MRTGQPGHFVPDDSAGLFPVGDGGPSKGEILHALGIQVNFAAIFAGQTLENLGKDALGSMAAVHKGRNDGETQVNASRGVASARPAGRQQTVRRRPGWAGGTRCRGATIDKRSARNPHTLPTWQTSWGEGEVRHTRK